MMKYLRIIGLFLFLVLASQIVSAQNVSKSDIRPILKEELTNYFEERPGLLNETEIKALLDAYTQSSGTTINLDLLNISPQAKESILARISSGAQSSNSENNNPAGVINPEGREYGERCKKGRDYECRNGKCMKSTNPFNPFYYCRYSNQDNLLGTRKKCENHSQCASGKCKKDCSPFYGCKKQRRCK